MGPKHSWKGSVGTGTDQKDDFDVLFTALSAKNWSTVVEGVATAGTWLAATQPGDSRLRTTIDKLIALAHHAKWEVRRAVAQAAAQTLHGDFAPALAELAGDNNAQVRKAAESAMRRRRDQANTSALGKQHEDRVNALLLGIEARFGVAGRDAVKRVSEEIANTFARELHHEVVRLLTPLSTSADRVVEQLNTFTDAPRQLIDEASRMKERIARVSWMMRAMRAYAAQPELVFAPGSVQDVINESIGIIRDMSRTIPPIEVNVEAGLVGDICRPRLVQAMTNLLANAVESYEGLATSGPITVHAVSEDERIAITIVDQGCGMSDEVLGDARQLFTTSKKHGTGFGLPLVVRIIESEHDGRLLLESCKGTGTTARVLLPLQRQRGRR